jgi:hypothetical protein
MFSVSGFSIRPNACKKIVIRQATSTKCGIQNVDLYIAFIELKKASVDSVDRPTLWKVLSKIGCPEKFINLVRLLQW